MSETGRRGNLIWNYFHKVDEDSKEAECKLCHNLYNYKTTSHNLKNHLKHKHNDEFMNLPAPETVEKKISRRSEGGASVWAYFEVYDSERKIASCNECKKTFSYKTTIHNLKTHLKRVHKEQFVEMEGGECEEVYLDDGDDDSNAQADVWSFFERAGGEARCAVCRALVPPSALRDHLRTNHPKLIDNGDSEDETTNNAQDEIYTEVVYLESEESPKKAEKSIERMKKPQKPTETRTRKRRTSSSDDEPLQKKSKTINEDEIEHFGKYITCLLKKVPQETSMELQMEIVNLILKKQLELKRKETSVLAAIGNKVAAVQTDGCQGQPAGFEKTEPSLSNGYSYTIENIVNVETTPQTNA